MKVLSNTFTKCLCFCIACAAIISLLIWWQHQRSMVSVDSCINHLRQIDGTKAQWALEQHKTTNDVPTWEQVRPYCARGVIPICPNGGTYRLGGLDEAPSCSVGGVGHEL